MMKENNKRFRTKKEMLDDSIFILNGPLTYGTKYDVLNMVSWLWTGYNGKYIGCQYWSKEALKVFDKLIEKNKKLYKKDEKNFIHEHVFPRNISIDKIINIPNLNQKNLEQLFEKYFVGAILTCKEGKELDKKYRQKMPKEFYEVGNPDYDNIWLRYKKMNISVVKVTWLNNKIISRNPIYF